jgi:hypothetical protein
MPLRIRAGWRQNSSEPEPRFQRVDATIQWNPFWGRGGIDRAKRCINAVMLNKVETEERQPNPATAKNIIAENGLKLLDPDYDSSSGNTARQRPEPASATKTNCLWCGRGVRPRSSGGSAQKFCCSAHRQSFWIAARRWTMLAVQVGLLSVDCLKASPASVHAARGTFPLERKRDATRQRAGRIVLRSCHND